LSNQASDSHQLLTLNCQVTEKKQPKKRRNKNSTKFPKPSKNNVPPRNDKEKKKLTKRRVDIILGIIHT